ncbi:MAG: DUF2793 domain-containing protein [Notoacmeibacter sp.]|nr:DUF2793 domain-containing protein [Notoacmeibacter sp.]
MERTNNLALPYILPSQAQKHVTHNEALRLLDALVQLSVRGRQSGTAPASPISGERHIVGTPATGAWAGHENEVALYDGTGWGFLAPLTGWLAHVEDEDGMLVYRNGSWVAIANGSNPVSLMGINTLADETNRLAVKSDAVLHSHDDVTPGSGDARHVLNKAGPLSTATMLYQSGWSGRAETGLAGDDNWHVKVSPDGQDWKEALCVDSSTSYVGVGTAQPARPLTIDMRNYPEFGPGQAGLLVIGNGGNERAEFKSAGNGPNAAFQGFGAHGDPDAPLAITDGRRLFAILGSGHDGEDYVVPLPAQIDMLAAGDWSPANHGSYMLFRTTPEGSTSASRAERMRITSTGQIGIGTATPTCLLHVAGPARVGTFTVANAPGAAACGAGALIFVTNEAAGPVMAFSDGANWRRVTDRVIVTAA